ncbi:hypothetical protein PMAYCL1PPCAC_19865 [Pristionchus mayeri]|uniref:Uncharacterized protein n=1 Tax=Pristionchus mayeri TaxID=1317129 RepID=A0AAN5CSB7_9BILA|nr:hypothetical protein PMAYCL1PPCAC_19865 [Pristionchus mayeri]
MSESSTISSSIWNTTSLRRIRTLLYEHLMIHTLWRSWDGTSGRTGDTFFRCSYKYRFEHLSSIKKIQFIFAQVQNERRLPGREHRPHKHA